MKIFAITNYTSAQRSTSFNGIIRQGAVSSEYSSYQGGVSSYNNSGTYKRYDDSETYTYHPFKGESKEHIEKVLRENNYSHDYDPEMTGGYSGSDTKITVLGRTIPYTEQEWNRLSKRDKERIESLL